MQNGRYTIRPDTMMIPRTISFQLKRNPNCERIAGWVNQEMMPAIVPEGQTYLQNAGVRGCDSGRRITRKRRTAYFR